MRKQISLLVLATMIWGFGFIAVKWTILSMSPTWANTLRYGLAASFSLPYLLWRGTFRRGLAYIWPPAFAALLLFLGMQTQNVGLAYTSVAKSGFFTTFYVFFVPLFGILILRKKYTLRFWALLTLALFGVALLCEMKLNGFNRGDFYTILCAICFAMHILFIGKITKTYSSAFELNALQCVFGFIFGLILALAAEPVPSFNFLLISWVGLLFLGTFSSLLAFTIQNYAQKSITPHVAGMIFLLESPFAAIFGFFILNEQMNLQQIGGSLCILLAVSLIQKS